MRNRLPQSNELNKKYTKNQENLINMEPFDENQKKVNKPVKKLKKNGQTLKEFAKIDSKATKIYKDKKNTDKIQTKINKYRPKSDPKYPKIDNNPSNLTAN